MLSGLRISLELEPCVTNQGPTLEEVSETAWAGRSRHEYMGNQSINPMQYNVSAMQDTDSPASKHANWACDGLEA